jgi:hypothetical protein
MLVVSPCGLHNCLRRGLLNHREFVLMLFGQSLVAEQRPVFLRT